MKSIPLDKNRCNKIPTGTKEWADYNINCIKGCFNNCRYCYAMIIAKRFGRATNETWKNMSIRDDVVNKNFRKYSGRVMFPSSHDIFDFPKYQKACFIVLDKLLKSGNEVLVTTKPRLPIIKKIAEEFSDNKGQIQFRFTITSIDNTLIRFWEPNAPLFEERLDSLKFAFQKGYKTSVSIEPFLDYNPYFLIETISPFITESIWIGIMNYIPRNIVNQNEVHFYSLIRENYKIKHLIEIFEQLNDNPKIRWKDSMKKKLKGIS